MVVSGIQSVLDLPFLLLGALTLVLPWRTFFLFRSLSTALKATSTDAAGAGAGENNSSAMKGWLLRRTVADEFVKAFLDVILIPV